MPSEITTPDGSVEVLEDGRTVLRFERRLRHRIERVWRALTEPDEVRAWFGALEVKLEPGGRYVVSTATGDAGDAPIVGTITRLQAPTLLEYDTKDGLVTWSLRSDGEGCVLELTHTNPPGLRLPDSVRAGWHWHVDALTDALDGRPVDWQSEAPRARMEALYVHYRSSRGRPASRS